MLFVPVAKLIVPVLLFIVAVSAFVSAQSPAEVSSSEYTRKNWTTENGLPQNSITAIAQTRDGYLWLGTFGGLIRFDGVRFTTFNTGNTSGLASNRITNLYEDKQGSLWIALEYGGITRYSNGKFKTYTREDGLPDLFVRRFSEDGAGNLWLSTTLGMVRVRDEKFSMEPTFLGLPNKPGDIYGAILNHWLTGRDGTEWLSTPDGLFSHRAGVLKSYQIKPYFVCETGDGSIWALDLKVGLMQIKSGSTTIHPVETDLGTDPLKQPFMFLAPDDSIWALTPDGLLRFKNGKKISSARIKGLPSEPSDVLSLLLDREGNVWVGSNTQGLYLLRQTNITAYAAEQGLADDSFTPITEDAAGTYWFGARALYQYREGSFSVYPLKIEETVTALYADFDGSLWVGHYSHLTHIEGGKVTHFNLKGIVGAIRRDRAGTLWIGVYHPDFPDNGGLARLRGEQFSFYRTPDGLVNNNVRLINEDRDGALWIGTTGGLSRFKDGRFTNYTVANGLSENYIREVYEDGDGILWIGTYGGGLNRLKDGVLTQITTKNGLFDNVVSRILEDEYGEFWMSSNRGIYRVSRQELNDFADGKIKSLFSVSYGVADGMTTSETNGGGQPAGWRDHLGRLWFPTIKGVVRIDPKRVNSVIPPVVVEKVSINQQEVDLRGNMDAAPGQGDIEIEYTSLSMASPEKAQFRYKLEGYDSSWVSAGTRRVAYYTNLPPGRYTFRVMAANNDGIWNEQGAAIDFRLRPHFYQTNWFYALGAFSLIGVVAGAYRYRIAKLRERHAAQQAFSRKLIESQEIERKRIAAELHDSLGQSLVIIKNRAALSLSQRANHERAFEHLEEIGSTASYAIDEVRGIIYDLRPYHLDRLGLTHAIEFLLGQIAELKDLGISTKIEPIDDLFSKDQEINVYRIVQEGISNIVKHADATEISVTIKRTPREVDIVIQDNGKGFEIEANGAHASFRRGLGLIGIEERARMLGGRSEIQSSVGRGTTIRINFALRKDFHRE